MHSLVHFEPVGNARWESSLDAAQRGKDAVIQSFVLEVGVKAKDPHSVASDVNRSPNHHVHKHRSFSPISLVPDQVPSPLFQVSPYPQLGGLDGPGSWDLTS